MTPLTFGQVKEELARISSFAGRRVDSDRLMEDVNTSQRFLFYKGTWPWLRQVYNFSLYGNKIALPQDFASLEKICFSFSPIKILNGWYEFNPNGPGPQSSNSVHPWVLGAIDRGFSPVTRQPGSDGLLLRAYSYEDERNSSGVRPTILVKGYDNNGLWIRSQAADGSWYDGFKLTLNGDSAENYDTSTISVSVISEIIKPKTVGRVGLYYVDSLGTLYIAGEIPFSATHSAFHIYEIPANSGTNTTEVQTLCRLGFKEILNDDDSLPVPSILGMRYMMMALAKEEAGKFQDATALKELALQQVQDEAEYFYPQHSLPAITIEDRKTISDTTLRGETI